MAANKRGYVLNYGRSQGACLSRPVTLQALVVLYTKPVSPSTADTAYDNSKEE